MSQTQPPAYSPGVSFADNDIIDALLSGSDTANVAEASVVAGLYGLFFFVALFNLVRDRLGAHLLLLIFCAVRVVCFSVRAYMQKHLTQNLAIVYEVFFAVGFVALVKLLVSLLYTWTMPSGAPLKRGRFSFGLLRNHGTIQERLITIVLLAGMVTNIIGATDAYETDSSVRDYNKGIKLLKAGYTIYLAAIVTYDVAVITGPLLHRLNFGRPRSLRSATLVALALEVCGLLLTCKSVFQVIAAFTNPSLTFHNKLFYPLEVLPELLVLCILCAPGFIRHIYKGVHAHPETDLATKGDTPTGATTEGIRPSSAHTTNGTSAADPPTVVETV